MKRHFFAFALGALVLGSLGSCTQQLDRLDREIEAVKSDKIATVEEQIAAINGSIADLETIRQNIQSLIDADKPVGDSLARLREADAALVARIDDLKSYVDNSLKAYAKTDWAEASFATLQQHEWTCDTIARIDARLTGLDDKLTGLVESTVTSLKTWVNTQLDAYYTVAELDVKLDSFQKALDSAGLSGNTKLVKLQEDLDDAKASLDSAKTNITNEYEEAIRSAIEQSEGKLTKAISDSIASVNAEVAALGLRVGTLEQTVEELTGRADALEGMVQSLAIVPAYSDGSVDVKSGLLSADVAVTPASAVESLEAADFKLIASAAGGLKEVEAASLSKDASNGTVTVTADITACLSDDLTVAVKVVKGISSIATGFVPVYESMSGQGTEQSPYLVKTASALDYLHTTLVAGSKTYVKLVSDIDMSSVESWVPLNLKTDKSGSTEFANEIDFDGNGKTIKNFTCKDQSYASFFGVLVGECRNVTFENAAICQESGNNSCGVVGGYVGTGARGGSLKNVTLKNCKVSFLNTNANPSVGLVAGNASSSKLEKVYVDKNCELIFCESYSCTSGIGGIIGKGSCDMLQCANCADIIAPKAKKVGGLAGDFSGNLSECYNMGAVSATENVGGLVGCLNKASDDGSKRYVISDCYSTGDLNNPGQKTGGIAANVCRYCDIKYCYSTGTLNGVRVLGGIVGIMANDQWHGNEQSSGGKNTMISCHVWCPTITHTQTNAGGGSGTIIGYANRWNTYKGCFRAPWYGNNDPNQTALSVASEPNEIPVDQEDCDPDHPITEGIKGTTSARGALSMQHTWPYHGKVSTQQKLTDLIKTLTGDIAWSTDIWDLTGDYPTLKNVPEE